jgi:hypothetical protein
MKINALRFTTDPAPPRQGSGDIRNTANPIDHKWRPVYFFILPVVLLPGCDERTKCLAIFVYPKY